MAASYMVTTSGYDMGWRNPGWGMAFSGPAAAIWPTANMIYYYPFHVPETFTAVAGYIGQSAAGAASLGRVGVYSATATGEPNAKLGETTSTIDLTTAGANAIRRTAFAANVTLSAGTNYFAAITVSSAAAWTGFVLNVGAGPTDNAVDLTGGRQEAGSGTLPSTATPADYAPASENFWLFGLTQSATVPL